MTPYASDLRFFLNGREVVIERPDPDLLLVDYLRAPDVGLTGTKIGCKQGGCGACTVLVSTYDAEHAAVRHRSINACMKPLVALDGMAVTTVEGTGSVETEVSPVQNALASHNGTQCGYCTPGWVMNMHGFLLARGEGGEGAPTRAEIQQHCDGNICRCTGYRPILYGFQKEFASDWDPERDEKHVMTCEVDPAEKVAVSDSIAVPFPDRLRVPPRPVRYEGGGRLWIRPTSLAELHALIAEHRSFADVKLVFGNTSVGVYDEYVEDPRVRIDVAHVAELRGMRVEDDGLHVGGATTYDDLLVWLDRLAGAEPEDSPRLPGLEALRYMARRTAGAIVRNAASLAGNTMLVLRHIDGALPPFPSDLYTALCALGAHVRVWAASTGEVIEAPLLDFADDYRSNPDLRAGVLLLGYSIPFSRPDEHVQVYKTALREVNAHTIVNAGFRVALDDATVVTEATLVVGGIASHAVRLSRAEAALLGRAWDWATFAAAAAALTEDVDALFREYADRLAGLPWEGFANEYKRELAQSFFYKFFVEVAEVVAPSLIPEPARSAALRRDRPVSRGTQRFRTYEREYPVNRPFVKLEAFVQATGEAVYPRDLPLPRRGLEGAYAISTHVHATFDYRIPTEDGGWLAADADAVLAHLRSRFPGIVDYITAPDLPEGQRLGGLAGDQPLLAVEGKLESYGQAIGLVLAEDRNVALDAAHLVGTELVDYQMLDPVVTIDDAVALPNHEGIFPDRPKSAPWYAHIWKVVRPNTDQGWPESAGPETTLDEVHCVVRRGVQHAGGQIHFYMETQTSLAVPGEEREMLLYPSTQDPDTSQNAVARMLGVHENKVDVRVRRIGGGYGGKTTQPSWLAPVAAFAAHRHRRPVRVALKREVDTAVFGHRHAARGQYAVAIGTGSDSPDNRGRIVGLQNEFYLNGGMTYDASLVISDTLQLRADSAYYIPNYLTSCDVTRTNLTSNTAMRTVGLIQGIIMQEEAIEAAAHAIEMLPEDVRARNLYQPGQKTPWGQEMPECYMQEVFEYARRTSHFDRRREEIERFNAENLWKKRGISLIPVKYASGYNLTMLEQAGALVEVFDQDGSLLVRTGGVEMGQGLNTKIAQIAAHALDVPLVLVRVAELDTAVIPNPTSTGASTGTAFNGEAVRRACEELRKRLEAYARGLLVQHGPEWCRKQKIDYWDYPEEGWKHSFSEDPSEPDFLWSHLVALAFQDRVDLSGSVRAAIHGGEKVDEEGLLYHDGVEPETVNQFVGFTYSAACTEVEIDVLTGETEVRRADIVYDMGKSLNPAIDVGQVEGAFVQGLGYVMYEELVYEPEGPFRGRLNTLNTWTYKPPAATSVPLEMHVDLYPFPDRAQDPTMLYSSKEVGEPPMTLAASAFFAIKHAILAAREDRGHNEWFDLESPATVQRVRRACRVELDDLETPG